VMHFDLALAFVIVARPELKLRLTNIAKPRLVLNEDHRFVHSCAPACWERIRLQGVSLCLELFCFFEILIDSV
jgi:hypothetical protein